MGMNEMPSWQREVGSIGCTLEPKRVRLPHRGRGTSWFLPGSPSPETAITGGCLVLELERPFEGRKSGILTAISALAYWRRSATRGVSDGLVARAVPDAAVEQYGFAVADLGLNDLRSRPLRIRKPGDDIVVPVFARDALARGRLLDRHAVGVRSRDQAAASFPSWCSASRSRPKRSRPPARTISTSQCQGWISPGFSDDNRGAPQNDVVADKLADQAKQVRGSTAVSYVSGSKAASDFSQTDRRSGAASKWRPRKTPAASSEA